MRHDGLARLKQQARQIAVDEGRAHEGLDYLTC
jgi:hypothetical protein